MEPDKIQRWLKIIALWSLFTAILGTFFYILIQVRIIDEKIKTFDLFEFYFNTIAGFMVFVGIWRFKSWGWKAAVLFIPVSWALSVYAMAIDYQRGTGMLTSFFLIIDALILRYLFKDDVIEFFQITSKFLIKLKLSASVLFFTAFFLFVSDMLNCTWYHPGF